MGDRLNGLKGGLFSRQRKPVLEATPLETESLVAFYKWDNWHPRSLGDASCDGNRRTGSGSRRRLIIANRKRLFTECVWLVNIFNLIVTLFIYCLRTYYRTVLFVNQMFRHWWLHHAYWNPTIPEKDTPMPTLMYMYVCMYYYRYYFLCSASSTLTTQGALPALPGSISTFLRVVDNETEEQIGRPIWRSIVVGPVTKKAWRGLIAVRERLTISSTCTYEVELQSFNTAPGLYITFIR